MALSARMWAWRMTHLREQHLPFQLETVIYRPWE
jgi:hypothetical protein